MHRNVIFNSDHAPMPFTAVDSNKPEDLWKYLEFRAQAGNRRARHSAQQQPERRPRFRLEHVGRAADRRSTMRSSARSTNRSSKSRRPKALRTRRRSFRRTTSSRISRSWIASTTARRKSTQHGSYIREAYGRGLVIQSKVGVNPFKMGIVGASDIHNGLSVSDENSFAGGFSGLDPKTMLPTGDAAEEALGMGETSAPASDPTGSMRMNRCNSAAPRSPAYGQKRTRATRSLRR